MNLTALQTKTSLKEIVKPVDIGLDLSSLAKGVQTATEFIKSPIQFWIKKFAEKALPVLADIGQSIARNIGSAGITLAKPIGKAIYKQEVEEVEIPDTLKWLFKDEPIKSIETRIAEAEPKIKKWGEESLVRKTWLGDFAKDNPLSLAFAGVMGSVGIDLTPFGGLEKNAFKAITKADNILDAMNILRKMGIANDIAREFAPEVVKTTTDKAAKSLFFRLAEMQRTTKVVPKETPQVLKVITRKEPTAIKGAGTEVVNIKGHPEIFTDANLLLEDRLPSEVSKWKAIKPSSREIDYQTVKNLYPKTATKPVEFISFEKPEYGNPIVH